ncbi:MAG: dynamin family protein [Selenomonadaceae bacterium]|nr:dynamin family protein [Selenomonadaceae bacterium]
MTQVYVKYNPYRLHTEIQLNGNAIAKDSSLYKVTGTRLQEWIDSFPDELRKETHSTEFDVTFYGLEMDWNDFEYTFRQAAKNGVIENLSLKFIEGKSTDNIVDKVTKIFNDLREGPIEAFKDESLKKSYDNLKDAVFPINVIATMSSGKSTLINALLAKKLMPSKNEACTATITEITDNDQDIFKAVVYNRDKQVIDKKDNLTYEDMVKFNDNPEVHRIIAEGDIPFIDANTTALRLVDTPGPNNSQNQDHKNTTYSAVNSDANNLILYVLNGTQLATNDDNMLLKHVAEKINAGGKVMRDRFLFVVNRMDDYNPEEENIESAIETAKKYLARHGIEDPQLFPCSAYVALNIRTYLKNIDPSKLTFDDLEELSPAASETLSKMKKFRKYDAMHLEKYNRLAPMAQRELNVELEEAVNSKDRKKEALIHCGIRSIEAAIVAYVKKYALTKKIKDLVETFNGVLEANEVLAKVKEQVTSDEGALKELVARSKIIRERIDDGKEAQIFKNKIAAFDPMSVINDKTNNLRDDIENEVLKIFDRYPDVITSKSEAMRLIQQFMDLSSDSMAKLSAELESIINRELVETGEKLLQEYQDKLTKFDNEATVQTLDFDTVSLVKDGLQNLRESINEWRSDSFANEKVDEIGEITTETKKYSVKVGTKTEEVIVGSHEEKVGTRQVKTGSHKETRTRTVKNPNKKWWSFWRDSYIDEDYTVTVDDYRTEDVFKTVLDYDTVERDVYEERTKTIEKYKAEKSNIMADLSSKYQRKLKDGIKKSLKYAEDQIADMKQQFSDSFDELDRLIEAKYREIEECAADQKTKEEELAKSKQILGWIETNKKELDSVLDI